jgi:hypothetical protein
MSNLPESAKYIAQKCLQYVPTIVLGSGYSAGYDLPTVDQLSKWIQDNLNQEALSDEVLRQWQEFKTISSTHNMEEALTKIGSINDELLKRIVSTAWRHIFDHDQKMFETSIREPRIQSLTRLIQYLFSSSNNKISIVTTNYDLLPEYAVACLSVIASTGFNHSIIGSREESPTTYLRGGFLARTVNIWKVHGSLDWFAVNGVPVRASLHSIPKDFQPLIITPGVAKYQLALKEPFRSILSGADSSLSNASSFICIGYGFNDEHIQEKLVDRVIRQAKPICILSKSLTPATQKFIKSLNGVEFIAIEQQDKNSIIYTHEHPNGFTLDGRQIWSLRDFMDWAIER